MVNVLFVCMGNICRSPTATGVFREVVRRAGLAHRIQAHGAGTEAWHVGKPPDERTVKAAARAGYDLSSLRAQVVTPALIARADYVWAMDTRNLAVLQSLASDEHRHKLRLFLDVLTPGESSEVPDPYYGGSEGFADVLDLCERGSEALLEIVRREHALSA